MDPMTPMSPRAQAALRQYRDARPGPHRRRRNEAALAARLAQSGGASRGASRWAPWWIGVAAFGIAAAVLILALAIAPRQRVGADARPSAEQAVDRAVGAAPLAVLPSGREPASLPPASRPSAPTPSSIEGPRSARPPSPRPIAIPDPPSAGVANDDAALESETRLVGEIRAAIDAGDDGAATAAIARHATLFPDGTFVEERLAYAIVLACRRGDAQSATLRTSFSSRYPSSHHDRMIRARCDRVR
jgi:hypothetical protein